MFVAGCVIQRRPKHRRNDSDAQISRKKVGFKFHFNVKKSINEIVKKHVCKQMFLNTLSIGEKSLRSWVLDVTASDHCSDDEELESSNVSTSSSQRSAAATANVEELLNSLPKVESHYCRASSSKLYLEPVWSSMREIHRHFVQK